MSVAARTLRRVQGSTGRILLNGDSGGVVKRVAQPCVARVTHDDDFGLSASAGNWSDPRMRPKRGVISIHEGP